MDRGLIECINKLEAEAGNKCTCKLSPQWPDQVKIEAGEREVTIGLKPLEQLYGRGPGKERVDPLDPEYARLFTAIEAAVLDLHGQYGLSDGEVLLAYRALAMKPEDASTGAPVTPMLQLQLRLLLSAADYSRDEVKYRKFPLRSNAGEPAVKYGDVTRVFSPDSRL